MLRLQVVSDLHLEFHKDKLKFNLIKPSCDILALVGDICCWGTPEDVVIAKRFFDEISPLFKNIIYVPGNHEYYNYGGRLTVAEINGRIANFCRAYGNISFLNNTSMEFDLGKQKYLVLGTTLWSYIPESSYDFVRKNMSDYDRIYVKRDDPSDEKKSRKPVLLSPADVTRMFARSVKFIKSSVTRASKSGHRVIILSHHKPYNDSSYDAATLDAAYSSDCSELFRRPVVLWAYGHTHLKDSGVVNGVLLYSNPKGYMYERTLYDRSAVLTV